MSNIMYKTRESANPQGRPKVYFTCHPSDFELYFDTITDEILQKQNCAVYYYQPNLDLDINALKMDLSQMQLFVIPVTTEFLCSDSRALSVEFKYAKEHNIPILPLLQENGLEELFNVKCGNIQCLNKTIQDDTVINYSEKLQSFLDAVLISDELAEKIRSAFDAYIFLSYRKKDRKYAQELMKLIHKNDFCRDIAIWYDEFLVPGENFNDAIADAMKKSELFAMVVTPNLVIEDNYVANIEYPMAKENCKKILPIESVNTDKKKLQEKFVGISDCVSKTDETGLSEALLQNLHNIAVKENDNFPEHNFFIGLAYLLGIDVEVDYQKAIHLIENAANAGIIEANQKLVDMYRHGLGVQIDFENAIKWCRQLCEILGKKYIETENFSDGVSLCEAYELMAELYIETDKYDMANEFYSDMLFFASLLLDYLDEDERRFYNIKTINALEFNDNAFKRLINRALKEQSYVKQEHVGLAELFIRSLCRVAYIKYKLGDFEESIRLYNSSLNSINNLCNDYPTLKEDSLKYLCYTGLENLYLENGQWNKALDARADAQETIQRIVEKNPSNKNLLKLAEDYDKFGDMCLEYNKKEKAKENYTKAFNIRLKLEDNKETKYLIALSLYNLSYTCNWNESEKYALDAVRSLLKLAIPGGILEAYKLLPLAVAQLCEIHLRHDKDIEFVDKYFLIIKTACERLIKSGFTLSNARIVMDYYRKFSAIYESLQEHNKALNNALLALEIANKIKDNYENSYTINEDIYSIRVLLGDVYRIKKETKEAKKNYDTAIESIRAILKDQSELKSKRDYTLFHMFAYAQYSCGSMLSGDEQVVYYYHAHKTISFLNEAEPNNEDYVKLKRRIEKAIAMRK